MEEGEKEFQTVGLNGERVTKNKQVCVCVSVRERENKNKQV